MLSSGILVAAAELQGQIRASERGSVSQTVDGTIITVDYARPQMRGRDSIFSRVVRSGETWTPGANWATTLELNRQITLNGQTVPTGKYSVWITTSAGTWTFHLNRNARLFHTQHPKKEEMFLSFDVTPETGQAPVEVLTFDFPGVTRTGTTLRLRWADVSLPLEIQVEPSRRAVAAGSDALAPYLGSYILTAEDDGKTVEMKAELIDAKGVLRAVVDGPWGNFTMEFIPTDKPHTFLPGFMEKGEVRDVEETPVIFQIENGRATGFTVAGIGDDIWMRARRKS
jgi:hypothetical protein